MAGGVVFGEGAAQIEVVEDALDLPKNPPEEPSQHASGISPYATFMFVTLTFNIMTVLLTSPICKLIPNARPVLAYWFTEKGHPVKIFFRKMAVYNTLITVIVHILHQSITATKELTELAEESDREGQKEEESDRSCVQPFSLAWLVLMVSGITLVGATIRFLAMILPHSRQVHGYTVYSPPPELGQQGHSGLTLNFSKVIRPFFFIGLLVLMGLGFLFLKFLPEHQNLLARFEFCTQKEVQDSEESLKKYLLMVFMILLPAISALAVEHVYFFFAFSKPVKTEVPGFYLILSSPFVISIFVTTWSGWIITMTLTYLAHGSSLELFTSYWKYYGTLDSFWMLLLFLVNTCKNKITS